VVRTQPNPSTIAESGVNLNACASAIVDGLG